MSDEKGDAGGDEGSDDWREPNSYSGLTLSENLLDAIESLVDRLPEKIQFTPGDVSSISLFQFDDPFVFSVYSLGHQKGEKTWLVGQFSFATTAVTRSMSRSRR